MKKQPDWAALRAEFPTLAKWTYLDTARKTIPPRCAEWAMQEYCRDVYENAGAEAWSGENVEATRDLMAKLLGAQPGEIAFTKNTTEGLNIAAHAFDLKPGDNIVLTDLEHVNNVWVWRHWEAKGVEIRFAQHRDGRLTLETFLDKIDQRTRVVSCAYVTYGNGFRVDLPALGKICRERDIKLVVDGVQAAGILAAPLSELGADMVALGGHKGLLGLTGTGLLYCRAGLIRDLKTPFIRPLNIVGAAVNKQFDHVHDAHRFEGGNPSFLGLLVMRRGAEFLQSIGIANIEMRVKELSTRFLDMVKKAGLKTQTPAEWNERAQIVNLMVPNAGVLQTKLRAQGVVVNVKDNALRVSMSFFNNEDDLERGLHAIKRELAGSKSTAAA
ncbi:MAG TPA: aminotransferase class V-fold PLP-dependent enzyme [Burkholderiales bacterium]|nr:aminotransferase class V-fold PLP-dependent enzyme [Burkholderiales bacterium]